MLTPGTDVLTRAARSRDVVVLVDRREDPSLTFEQVKPQIVEGEAEKLPVDLPATLAMSLCIAASYYDKS